MKYNPLRTAFYLRAGAVTRVVSDMQHSDSVYGENERSRDGRRPLFVKCERPAETRPDNHGNRGSATRRSSSTSGARTRLHALEATTRVVRTTPFPTYRASHRGLGRCVGQSQLCTPNAAHFVPKANSAPVGQRAPDACFMLSA
eukprot:3697944-Prymnesium_polylepis.1